VERNVCAVEVVLVTKIHFEGMMSLARVGRMSNAFMRMIVWCGAGFSAENKALFATT